MTYPPSESEPHPRPPAAGGGGTASGTDAAQESQRDAFERLHPTVRRWIYQQGWPSLRGVQVAAVDPVMSGRDVVISAATASGKTEAAWLPIVSHLAEQNDRQEAAGALSRSRRAEPHTTVPGVRALYLGPLKALINDQHQRLESLGEAAGVPVHKWHGDVSGSHKTALLRRPDGIVLITPESLEAMMVNRGTQVPTFFSGLGYIVVDELHSFMGSERGAQLQSLLHRLDLALRRRVPRVGLSATLHDLSGAADFLRPGSSGQVVQLDNPGGASAEIRIQVRGYIAPDKQPTAVPEGPAGGSDVAGQDEPVGSEDERDVAAHLFKTLRGTDNLVFANSRNRVELYSDMLSSMSKERRVPEEFFAHHGNLSKEQREFVEDRLRDPQRPATAVCTSTLEMGIDIGTTDAVAQLGAPPSVASLRQRLGRSGRRGSAAVLRIYVNERELNEHTQPADQVRAQLFQCVAMADLMLFEKWYEPTNVDDLHLSTLIQQVLSVSAQHGGVSADDLYQALCSPGVSRGSRGPFGAVTREHFDALIAQMVSQDLLASAGGGLLLPGGLGDKIVNHYSFYAAFTTPEEFRVVTGDGKTLGSLPIHHPVAIGGLLIFGGRRWTVVAIDTTSKVITLGRAAGGNAPMFGGNAAEVADRVRRRMRTMYESESFPVYLDRNAQVLLEEGRRSFRRLRLAETMVVGWGQDTVLFPWRGDRIHNTVAIALGFSGLPVGLDGVTVCVRAPVADVIGVAAALCNAPRPSALELAGLVEARARDKYDRYLGDELLDVSYAARSLDVDGGWEVLRDLAAETPPPAQKP